jgi:hypothetical protein
MHKRDDRDDPITGALTETAWIAIGVLVALGIAAVVLALVN